MSGRQKLSPFEKLTRDINLGSSTYNCEINGTNFGVRYQLSSYQDVALNLVTGLHLTHIILDSLDTKGKIN